MAECQRRYAVSPVYSGHSEGLTRRNEAAVATQAGTTRHPGLVVCIPKMNPQVFIRKACGSKGSPMFIEQSEEAIPC